MRVILNALQAGNRSGTGRYTEALARLLPGMARDVEVVPYWPAATPPPALTMGERVVQKRFNSVGQRLRFDQWGIRGALREEGATFAHYPANVGAVLPGIPNVVTVHDLSFLRHREWFSFERALYYRNAVARSVKTARRVFADSSATAHDLMTLLGVPEERIDVIPLGVEPSFAPADGDAQRRVRETYRLPETFFLYVGTLEPRKNLAGLIRAWSRVADQVPQDLVIAGRDGWKVKPIRDAVVLTEMKERIHFPGFIAAEDLPALLSTAHAFTWPSLWEGFGLPLLEAMACGAPVLTSDKSSIPEVVGDAAVMVDPYDVDALARELLRFSRDEKLCAQLHNAGMARARAFTWERCAELTLDAYRKAGA